MSNSPSVSVDGGSNIEVLAVLTKPADWPEPWRSWLNRLDLAALAVEMQVESAVLDVGSVADRASLAVRQRPDKPINRGGHLWRQVGRLQSAAESLDLNGFGSFRGLTATRTMVNGHTRLHITFYTPTTPDLL